MDGVKIHSSVLIPWWVKKEKQSTILGEQPISRSLYTVEWLLTVEMNLS